MNDSPSLVGATAILDAVAADARLIQAGRLQRACASFFTPSATTPAQGVVLCLHGWSAGPWQFAEVAPHLQAAGFHVYAARLPGHGGLAAGREDASGMPKAGEPERYGEAGETALQAARALALGMNLPLAIFGFSMGGAMALDLALSHPERLAGLILGAPLLNPAGLRQKLLFRALHRQRRLGLPTLLDRLPISWGALPEVPVGGWVRPGHWHFRVGHLFSALSFALQVKRRAARQPLRVPLQLFLNAHDRTCEMAAAVRLLGKSQAPTRVWTFPERAGLPHALLTAGENPDLASRQRIGELTVKFLQWAVSGNRSQSP